MPSIPSDVNQYKNDFDNIFHKFGNGSSSTINSYALSSGGHSSTSVNSAMSESNYSNRLPPPIPQFQRRGFTPIRRSNNTIGLDYAKKPVLFQTKPLKNLTVISWQSPTRSLLRSPSPSLSLTGSNYSLRSTSCPARRTFPQTFNGVLGMDDLSDKDDSSLVLDANLTFVLGCKSRMKPQVSAVPAHLNAQMTSNALTKKISDFLQRTDHVMDEWKGLGRPDDENHNMRLRRSYEGRSMSRCRSATNIMIKGFQYYSRSNSCSRSSMVRDLYEDATEAECDEVDFCVFKSNAFLFY